MSLSRYNYVFLNGQIVHSKSGHLLLLHSDVFGSKTRLKNSLSLADLITLRNADRNTSTKGVHL